MRAPIRLSAAVLALALAAGTARAAEPVNTKGTPFAVGNADTNWPGVLAK